MMNASQIKNAKIDAITMLQEKYRRFSNALNTDGVNKAEVEQVISKVRSQIESLEAELSFLN
jgi:hypothetical protein